MASEKLREIQNQINEALAQFGVATTEPPPKVSKYGAPPRPEHDASLPVEQRMAAAQKAEKARRTGGRVWTESDYRLRGLKTPAERAAAPKRARLNTFVTEQTLATIHRVAQELGVTVGEALDELLNDKP